MNLEDSKRNKPGIERKTCMISYVKYKKVRLINTDIRIMIPRDQGGVEGDIGQRIQNFN